MKSWQETFTHSHAVKTSEVLGSQCSVASFLHVITLTVSESLARQNQVLGSVWAFKLVQSESLQRLDLTQIEGRRHGSHDFGRQVMRQRVLLGRLGVVSAMNSVLISRRLERATRVLWARQR